MEPNGPQDPVEPGESEAFTPRLMPEPAEPCWRCGRLRISVEASAKCPFCEAVPRQAMEEVLARHGQGGDKEASGLVPVVWGFALMLTLSVIYTLITPEWTMDDLSLEIVRQEYHQLAFLDIAFTIIVLVTSLVVLNRVKLPWRLHSNRKALAWILALPVLAALLGINFFYHNTLLGGEDLGYVEFYGYYLEELWPWAVLLICISPAIVEEIFFRYLCLGLFMKPAGMNTAVIVSGIMFAAAHASALLSFPVLVLVGISLGYFRVFSGGLLLPMCLHFLHNLVVVYLAAQ